MNHLENFKKNLEETTSSTDELIEKFISVRAKSIQICENLETEDFVIQPCPEVSPPKWHLAHTTWFFEELILVQFSDQFSRFDESFQVLFNSYYKSAGKHWIQGNRGDLSRPTVKNIFKYREYIDSQMVSFLRTTKMSSEVNFLLTIGLHHEQQHQELLLMDIKYILGSNPMMPAYSQDEPPASVDIPRSWKEYKEGIYEVGHRSSEFAYDNEGPKHKVYLYPFSIRENTVSNGEYLDFMNSGGYSNPQYWLSEGWDWLNRDKIGNPLYWKKVDGEWFEFTLYGLRPLDLNAPVTHINYFEADAFAHWTNHRLPTEHELEIFLKDSNSTFDKEVNYLQPTRADLSVGQVWCWSKSHYSPYPGFRTFKGMLGEYNGKFMCNQFVLKGGCIATDEEHYRHTYRNFYQPHQRWMFSGIRIAKDLNE